MLTVMILIHLRPVLSLVFLSCALRFIFIRGANCVFNTKSFLDKSTCSFGTSVLLHCWLTTSITLLEPGPIFTYLPQIWFCFMIYTAVVNIEHLWDNTTYRGIFHVNAFLWWAMFQCILFLCVVCFRVLFWVLNQTETMHLKAGLVPLLSLGCWAYDISLINDEFPHSSLWSCCKPLSNPV